MGTDGTSRAIGPIADEVLAWVARERGMFQRLEDQFGRYFPEQSTAGIKARLDDLRRIELCALAAREAAMFHDLYGLKEPSGHLCFGDCYHEEVE